MANIYVLSETTHPILFRMVLASDHLTAATGLVPVVTLSKNGGAFAAAAGAVAELIHGWYKLTPTSADTNTVGALVLHAAVATADDSDVVGQVVAFDVTAATVTVAGNVTVGGYAAGQDPKTLVGNVTIGAYAAGEDPGALVPAGPVPSASLARDLLRLRG